MQMCLSVLGYCRDNNVDVLCKLTIKAFFSVVDVGYGDYVKSISVCDVHMLPCELTKQPSIVGRKRKSRSSPGES